MANLHIILGFAVFYFSNLILILNIYNKMKNNGAVNTGNSIKPKVNRDYWYVNENH